MKKTMVEIRLKIDVWIIWTLYIVALELDIQDSGWICIENEC